LLSPRPWPSMARALRYEGGVVRRTDVSHAGVFAHVATGVLLCCCCGLATNGPERAPRLIRVITSPATLSPGRAISAGVAVPEKVLGEFEEGGELRAVPPRPFPPPHEPPPPLHGVKKPFAMQSFAVDSSHRPRRGRGGSDTVLLAVSGNGVNRLLDRYSAVSPPSPTTTPALGSTQKIAVRPLPNPAPVPTWQAIPKVRVNASKNRSANMSANRSGNKSSAIRPKTEVVMATTQRLTTMFWVVVPLVISVSVAFEMVHYRWAGIDLTQPIEGLQEGSVAREGMPLATWLGGIWPLVRQFFLESGSARLAQLLLVMITFLHVFTLFMDWVRNMWQRMMWDSIQHKQSDRFWQVMVLFVQMAVVNVVSSTYKEYIMSILQIRWRTSLTKSLQERWLLGRAYCTAIFPAPDQGDEGSTLSEEGTLKDRSMDNPDQRLQEDCGGFISSAAGLVFGVFMYCGRVLVFTPVLFHLSPSYAFGLVYCPGWLLYVSLVYSFIGSTVVHYFGKYLVPLNFVKQAREADYRYQAVQVRDNIESIAMYNSEGMEHQILSRSFDRVQRVVWEQMKVGKHLGFFSNFYDLANDVVPFCILAGNFFSGQITLGEMMQILSALGHVQQSLNGFVAAYPDLTDTRATVDRLWGFCKALDHSGALVSTETVMRDDAPPGESAALFAKDVRVALPGQRLLWDSAGLVVQPGERVLLLGPDGCGKSVFLRALAGCWPAHGAVHVGREGVLFVPQRPFVPAGTLREAISYPEASTTYGDAEMSSALQVTGLTSLLEVPLDERADWQSRLSGGEKQRLAIAHAILRNPGVLVLDESMSAVGELGVVELYAALADRLSPTTAVISVNHDATGVIANWHVTHYTKDQSNHSWVQTHPQVPVRPRASM